MLQADIATRLSACKLELHPQKTKIVYCMDSNRRLRYPKPEIRFSGLQVSAPAINEPGGKTICELRPCGER